MNSNIGLVAFSQVYERDTALLLDNGLVCGGPIQICKYQDLNAFVNDNNQVRVIDELAKQLCGLVKTNPSDYQKETKQVHSSF